MTYPIFDHLRMLSDILTASCVILGVGSLIVCIKLLATSMSGHQAPIPV
jgi:hypothetical protein